MPENNNKKKDTKPEVRGDVLKALAIASTIGIELAITVVLGFYGGRYLDNRFATGPWLMLAGVLTGLAVGTVGVFKTLRGFFERE